MKKLVCLLMIVLTNLAFSQGTAGSDAGFEPRCLVDMQTAGVLEKTFFAFSSDIMPAGVVVTKMEVGVFKDFSFGISYGAENIIGSGSPNWYRLPGVNVKLRIMDETTSYPGVSLGFDSQGKGRYQGRYEIKAPGIFCAASKNYQFLGFLSMHALMNYSALESGDDEKDINFIVVIVVCINN